MTRTVLFLRNAPLATEALLAEAFGEFGYDVDTFDVVTADSGETALNVVARQRPSLIVLDAGLRTEDGAEVLEVLQSESALASIPVLLTTSADDEAIKEKTPMPERYDCAEAPRRANEVM